MLSCVKTCAVVNGKEKPRKVGLCYKRKTVIQLSEYEQLSALTK